MMWEKIFHVPIIAIGVLVWISLCNGLGPKDDDPVVLTNWRMHAPFRFFWLAGVLSGLTQGGTPVEHVKRVVKTTLSYLGGFIVFIVVVVIFSLLGDH